MSISKVGNPYPHRYKHKRERTMTEKEFLHYLENAKVLEEKRLQQRERGKFPFDFRVQVVSISGLLAMLHYTGLRITEIVGDKPHKYVLKSGEEKYTNPLHGIRQKDLSIQYNLLKVDVKEVRKHGKREEPIWIPLNKPGVDSILEAWRAVKDWNGRVFPVTKWLGWRLISEVTEGKLYPHYFRMNRATKFAENPETSLLEIKKWFAWADMRTASGYMAKVGRTTKPMAERLQSPNKGFYHRLESK